MAGRNYYDILGIKKDSSEKEVKQAYRRLARKYHPDVNPGDKSAEDKFKEINEAYEVLSDKENRKKYDRYGDKWQYADQLDQAGQQQQQQYRDFAPGGGGSSFSFSGGDVGDLGGIFEGFFSGGRTGTYRRQVQPRRGQDLESPVEVTLEEAYQGTSRTINLQSGELCSACKGSGYIQNLPCSECRGSGVSPKIKRLEVKIPAGVQNGSRVRVAGKGQPGYHGGPSGNLYLKISVKSHAKFERHGDNLHVSAPVPLATAMLGGEVQVPTPKGQLALKIPAETQNGRVFRLTGQGMPHLGKSTRGDILAKVNVVLPTKLSEEEKDFFKRLGEKGGNEDKSR